MISVRHISKRFGAVQALDDVSFQIPAGAVFGLVGPNGAGKTTCLNILATLMRPDVGHVVINERHTDTHALEVRRALGYVPDFFGLTRGLTVVEYLDFYGGCCGVRKRPRQARIEAVLEQTGLLDITGEQVDALSRGMKQRLCLAKALLHEPAVLILDEPASGLDPRSRRDMIALLKRVAEGNTTIVISSHILSELDVLCTHVGIIDKGRMIRSGSMAEILEAARPRRAWVLAVTGDPGRLVSELTKLDYVLEVALQQDTLRLSMDHVRLRERGLPTDALPAEVLVTICRCGVALRSASEDAGGLEDAFLKLTEAMME